MLLLVCSCNDRSCRGRILGLDQIKTLARMESVAVSAGRSPFSLTLNTDLEGGAVTLVLCCHLTPVAPSVSGDHFDDLHFISVDLGEKISPNYFLEEERKYRRGSDHRVEKMHVSVWRTPLYFCHRFLWTAYVSQPCCQGQATSPSAISWRVFLSGCSSPPWLWKWCRFLPSTNNNEFM